MADEISPTQAVNRLIQNGRELARAVELNANSLADLLETNLRSVSAYRLARLKAALRGFNSNTREWKP